MKKFFVLALLAIFSFNVFANGEANRLIEDVIKDDFKTFKDGGKANLSNDIPTVGAAQLIKEYENNQFKYEKTYAGKLVHIKTVASGVKTDLSGDPYVVANGKNQFEHVSLELKNKDDAMNINKGDKVDLICLGTKRNVLFPVLKSCVATDGYLNQLLESTMTDLSKLTINDVPKTVISILYVAFLKVDEKYPDELKKYKTINDAVDKKNKHIYDEINEIKEELKKENITSLPSYNLQKL